MTIMNHLLAKKNLKTDLFEKIQKDIKFSDSLADHIKWAYNNIYSVSYPGEHSLEIARYYHGIQHVTRAALHVPVFINLYRKHGDPDALNLTEADIKLLQLAAVFHDSAREDEGVDKWDHESGMLLYSYLTQGLGVSKNKAKMIAEAMANKDVGSHGYFEILDDKNGKILWQWNTETDESHPKNIYQKIVHDVDCVEIIRARASFDASYLDFYKDIACKNPMALEEMAHLIIEIRKLIDIQGDKYSKTRPLIKKKYEHQNACVAIKNDISQQDYPIMHALGDKLIPENELKQMQIVDMTPYDETQGLTTSNLRAAMREGKVLSRAVSSPTARSVKHREESLTGLELRKTMRTKGIATRTQKNDRLLKEHNPFRSVSVMGYGSGVFSNVGYVIINPEVDSIRQVFATDFVTGFGKKEFFRTYMANVSTPDVINSQLVALLRKMKLGGEVHEFGNEQALLYPELICDIKNYQAIFYSHDETRANMMYLGVPEPIHPHVSLLQAIYLRDHYAREYDKSQQNFITVFGEEEGLIKHRERFGTTRFLPVFEYSGMHNKVEATTEAVFTAENIKRLWVEMCTAYLEKEIASSHGLDVLVMNVEDIKTLSMYAKFRPSNWREYTGQYMPADEFYDSNLKNEVTQAISQVKDNLIAKLKKEVPPAFFQFISKPEDQEILLNNVMRYPDLQRAFADPNLSSTTVERLLLLTRFKIEKIKDAEKQGYERVYRHSIENFYKKSIDILVSDKNDNEKDKALRTLANNEFGGENGLAKLLLDILMVITLLISFPIGIYRVHTGQTFFLSQQKTERVREIHQMLDTNTVSAPGNNAGG